MTDMHSHRSKRINRRAVLVSGIVGAGLMCAPRIVRAQGARKIRLSLPWVAQGSTLYPQVAQQAGFWSKRGLDVDIARGYGSFAAVQAMATDKFDFAIAQFPPLVISVAKNLPVTTLAVANTTAGWAIGISEGSPIKKPQDLAGRTIAGTASATDYIILHEYFRRVGVDPASVKTVQVDSKILEQVLISRQVDAITAVISSSAPVFVSQKFPIRFLPYREVGLDAYGLSLTGRNDLIAKDPELVKNFTEGLIEGMELALTQPDEALKLFIKAVPEVELSSTGADFARIGLGTYQVMADSPTSRNVGLGHADPDALRDQIDLTIKYLADPGVRVPSVAEVYNPTFLGNRKLTSAQWDNVAKSAAAYWPLFKSTT